MNSLDRALLGVDYKIMSVLDQRQYESIVLEMCRTDVDNSFHVEDLIKKLIDLHRNYLPKKYKTGKCLTVSLTSILNADFKKEKSSWVLLDYYADEG